ncbi:MAG: ATP-binding protein [Candidatus Aegiribacteria sp.]|nr:ATP-binding protein [Candidatus Aegiribacteria sp.]
MIPFKVGIFVTGKDFCGREAEIRKLTEYIESSFRVLIAGERRTGKSSLIMETSRRMPGWKFAYIDLRTVSTMEKLCERTANGIYSAFKTQSVLKNITNAISSLRPGISIDSQTGDFKVSISPGAEPDYRSMEELLRIAGKPRTIVVFDELQDIMELPDYETILAGMRTVIQNQPDTAYIFSGSILHGMNRLFTDPDAAFFRSAQQLNIGKINRNEFADYIRERFKNGQRTVTENAMDEILQFGRGNPGDIQRLCIGIWEVTDKNIEITTATVQQGMTQICNLESESFADKLAYLSPNQIRCLSTITAMDWPIQINSKFISNSGLSSYSAALAAMKGLEKKRILLHRGHNWNISTPFFIHWFKTSGLV